MIFKDRMKRLHFKGSNLQGTILSTNMGGCFGFTMVEIMIVTSIICILASIAIPNYIAYRKKAIIAQLAADLVNFEKAFMIYANEQGGYPNDSHIVLPDQANMANHIDPADWSKPTPLGGTFNWEGPDNYPYAGVSIFEGTAPVKDFVLLDEYLDDGNLSQGRFRLTPNGRYTYIIDE